MRIAALAVGLTAMLALPALAQDQAGDKVAPVQRRPATPSREFFELRQSIDQLRRDMDQLRVDVEARRSREMTPEIYRSLMKRLAPVHMSHEVVLTNGTVVRGNMLEEDLTQIIIETSLGNLTLPKSAIRSIVEMVDVKPNIEFLGDPHEEFFTGYRTYTGEIRNDGVTRADFVRVIFKLWDAKSDLVAVDSAFVSGMTMTYLSGVASDTALDPGQGAIYAVRVDLSESIHVEYFTREIIFDQID